MFSGYTVKYKVLFSNKWRNFLKMARHSNFDRRKNAATNFMNILQARRRSHVLKTCLVSCIHQRRQTLLKISALLMLLTNACRI